MLKKYGYIRVAAAVNKTKVADIFYNIEEIKNIVKLAKDNGVDILTFPELSITGYTCQDLFLNEDIINNVLVGIKELVDFSNNIDITFLVGAPIKYNNSLFNCAVSISKGKIIGITPKTYIPNYSEFYEGRYFKSASELSANSINLFGENIPFSNMLIYRAQNYPDLAYAVEICEDLWLANCPSNFTALAGANIIFNLSSSNEYNGKYKIRKNLVKSNSYKNIAAYVYASTGITESTSDVLFSGHAMIYDGEDLVENKRFDFESNLIYHDVDVQALNNRRLKKNTFNSLMFNVDYIDTYFDVYENDNKLVKKYSKNAFLNNNDELEEILNIQSYALARRVKYLNNSKMVIGISGGSDSTLAFLVCLRAAKILNLDSKNIIAITMPGFGTSSRTLENSKKLISSVGATFKEISIREACVQHYKDIEHADNVFDITYENSQARERTQILFDYANKVGGIVIGTGDLSEIALGWATYNGDHMSNYAVNCSIPKTLVKALIAKERDNSEGVLRETLTDILDTPISPELLPLDKDGKIAQKSEDSVGPYIIHDFFLYHFIKNGFGVKKLFLLAAETFDFSKEEIKKYLGIFIKRFFTQQFKKNCVPDGIKAVSVGLSPRGDFRMSSDIYYNMLIKELEEI